MGTNSKFAVQSIGNFVFYSLKEDKNRPKFIEVNEKTYKSFLKWFDDKETEYDIHSNMISENISVYLVGDGFDSELIAGIDLSNHSEKYNVRKDTYENFLTNRELTPSSVYIKQQEARTGNQVVTIDMKSHDIELSLPNDIELKLLKFVKSDIYKPYHINVQN